LPAKLAKRKKLRTYCDTKNMSFYSLLTTRRFISRRALGLGFPISIYARVSHAYVQIFCYSYIKLFSYVMLLSSVANFWRI